MNPCNRCAAPCCRQYYVSIDAYDVYRIVTGLKVPASDFAMLRWSAQPGPDFRIILDGGAPVEQRAFFGLALGKVPDPDPRFEERCVFLMSVGGEGRCGIYEHRPSVCRVYPTSFEWGVVALGGGGRFCPPGGWQMDDVVTEMFRERWHAHKVHHWLHQEIIDGWNERLLCYGERAEPEGYYLYVLRVYAELARAEPSLFEPRLLGWPPAIVKEIADRALRAIAWRNDDTVHFNNPEMGWTLDMRASSFVLTPAAGQSQTVLVLDEDEDIDPEGAYLAKLLGR